MRDVLEVLRQKECELETVKQQVDALRLTAALLVEEADGAPNSQTDQIVWKSAETGQPVSAW